MLTRWLPTVSKPFRLAPYLALLSLSYLSLGVTIPAMSLIVISKGFSLSRLSLAMIVFSLSVMAFEVPSGIYADAKGRRKSFALGLVLSLIGTLLLFSSSYLLLCAGFACTGIGRAYASGSLDALMIERGQRAGKKLEDIVFALDVNSGISLSVGSLLGGLLLSLGAQLDNLTSLVLLVRVFLVALSLLLLFLLIPKETQTPEEAFTFKAQANALVSALSSSPFLLAFSLSVLVQGVLLASLEGYWQPYLKQLLVSDSQLWILGLISASVFSVSVLGSMMGKRLLSHMRPPLVYCLAFAGIFALQLMLSRSHTIIQFLLFYELIYLLLGVVSVVGMYLLNKKASDAVRTSLVSVSSFCLQTGGLLANLLATVVFLGGGISRYWVITALGGLGMISILSVWLLQRTPRT